MNNELFIISYELDELDELYELNENNKNNSFICYGIYIDLEKAKKELKKIYNNTPDYKYYCYKIMVYNSIDNEYKFSNKIYTYKFNEFTEHN